MGFEVHGVDDCSVVIWPCIKPIFEPAEMSASEKNWVTPCSAHEDYLLSMFTVLDKKKKTAKLNAFVTKEKKKKIPDLWQA